MARATLSALKTTLDDLTQITGLKHNAAPRGSGFWDVWYEQPTPNGEIVNVNVCNRKDNSLMDFLEGYRRGYSRCLERNRITGYQRVIPRDLFNEAKLKKCLGQLSLLIHDGKAGSLVMEHDDPERGFVVEQDESCGALYCSNLRLMFKGREIKVKSCLNSRDIYPLVFEYDANKSEGEVFNDDGTLHKEFTDWLAKL